MRSWLNVSLLIAGFLLNAQVSHAQMSRSRNPPQDPNWIFEADIDSVQENRIEPSHHLLYDRGKMREDYFSPQPRHELTGFSRLYDGKSNVVWDYFANERRAMPTLGSCFSALSAAARRYGEAEARQRYKVPAGYESGHLTEDHQSRNLDFGLFRVASETSKQTRLVGVEPVAGFACQLYERRNEPTQAGQPTATWRYWVEPKSRLALRFEILSEFPPSSRMPPRRNGYIARRVRFLKSLPDHRFQLPAGTTAILPATLKDMALPSGVKRGSAPGDVGLIGVDLHHPFPNQ